MRSSTVPARVSQSRSPLRWLRRSALRSPCPAPHRASLSNSIRRCAAKPIISRRNVASEPFSRSSRRAILSSVIVVILGSELRVATQPYSGSPRRPLTGLPAPDSWRSLRRAGQRSPTPSPGTRPLGFDPRAVSVSQELISAGGQGRRDLWLLCYDNGQETTDAQRQIVAANDAGFQALFSAPRSIMRLPIAMRTDRARSATCQNTKAAISRPQELLGYDDVIIDISALPRMISLMAVARLLALVDDRQAKGETAPNLHVVAAESAAEDFGTAENSLDADVILLTGFSESDSKWFICAQSFARRRERSRRLARRSQAVALWVVASKSLARRRLRPSQAKVRSTTHRRGSSWKPLTPGGRSMIWIVQGPQSATASRSWAPR